MSGTDTGATPTVTTTARSTGARARSWFGPASSVLEANLTAYRRTWRSSVFSSFLLPLLTVLSFGVGVGAYVDQGVGGFSYLDWIVPGLIASTALQVAIGESSWPVLGGFTWQRTYYSQIAAPLRIADIVGGLLAFVLLRVLASAVAFVAVAAAFGALHSGWAVLTLPVAVLLAAAVALPVAAFAATIRSDSYMVIVFRFAVIPMTLFAGVFFPVESLPVTVRWLAYLSPLWHGVDLCRAASLGITPAWSVPGHLGYLSLWAAAGWWLAVNRFRKRLIH
ncbi:ABC transporter permease [Solwaraspora sp. WMMA2080]|uniref:ABC transporter permease n=1 Tax=unclassified Solwaraspora TaxID=2627926 RepID=UPI00248C71F0|nr:MULTISPECIES: ABC transporter permease [unclassified Solwaraspora]WBB95358.1 ABC transporter permease [Solwaraspora sp. WMMA2059]WBC20736.1 ABC transporter permease [Solwaraspora sp. WMMA2080]